MDTAKILNTITADVKIIKQLLKTVYKIQWM